MGAMFHYIAKFTISRSECKYIKYNVLKIPTDFLHISYSLHMKRMRWKVQYQIEKTPMRKVTLLGKSAMHMEQIGHST